MFISKNSKLFRELNNNPNYIAEPKKDGWRAIIDFQDGNLTIWSRHKTILEAGPSLTEQLKQILKHNVILDGELLGKRSIKTELLYIFDIIAYDRKLVVDFPLAKRRELLEKIIQPTDCIKLLDWVHHHKQDFYYQCLLDRENEGIVLKNLKSSYTVSTTKCLKVSDWLKVKEFDK